MAKPPVSALILVLGAVLPGVVGCSDAKDERTDLGVSALLFVKRAHTQQTADGVMVDVAGGNGQVIDYDRYVPGGSLNMLKPARADGQLINLTKDFPDADFNGVDVSFDGKQAVFSMKKDPNDHYHLYTVQVDGGSYELHQKTAGDYDDMTPIYMPGGRIIFVTNQMYTEMGTRADEYEHARSVTQLATISVDGGDADRRLFSQNLSHTVAPFARYDGKIGYSRWEHVGPVNDVKVFTVNPDGTQMIAVAGQHGKPSNSLVNIRETSPNVMIGIATSRNRTIHAGALVRIDARNVKDPVCLDDAADKTGHPCLDEENVQYDILTPDVPTGNGPSPVGRYREPAMLPDGRLIVSWADGPVNDLSEQSRTPPDFGIYVFDPKTKKNKLVYNDRDKWDLNAVPVVARKEPPVIGDLQRNQDPSEPVRIGSVDVTNTSLQESVDGAQFANTPLNDALHGAVAVRVIEGFSTEATPALKNAMMFGLTMHEGAAVLGEATIYGDGSWLANVPPYVPMRLQPIDKFGMAIRSQSLWIQGVPGEDRRCVGCHESRSGQGVPRFGQNPTVAEQKQAMNFVKPIADREELPWDHSDVGKFFTQQLLTDKCSSCHNSTTTQYYTISMTDPTTGATAPYKIPTLDLTEAQVATYYDRQVKSYNASYVSIFYPAALEMEMGKMQITSGTVPPKWGVPGSARASKLIEKINVKAPDGTTAWPTPMHPEDKGVTLTDQERRMLILAMDLGGQYISRQNTGFVPLAAGVASGGVKY
jgi:hypothetical protein